MLTNVEPVTTDHLLKEVAARQSLGHRFITITCTDRSDHFDLLYHFDLDGTLSHLRLRLERNQPLPSVTRVCFAAIPVENEIKDLFGIAVQDLILDFGGRFLLSEGSPIHPQRKADAAPAPAPSKD